MLCMRTKPWTVEDLFIEAKRFKTKSKFHKGASGAYDAAKRLDVFDDVCAHMKKAKKRTSKWTINKLTDLINLYETIDDFRKNEKAALKFIYRNKLNRLLLLIPSTRTPQGFWKNVDNLTAEALKYDNRVDFSEQSSGAYNAALKHEQSETVFSHMEEVVEWNKEKILAVARQFETRTEFRKVYEGAYSAARRLDILEIACEHMQVIGSKYERAIYAFEFEDKSVYVGLTFNYEQRYKEHLGHDGVVGIKAKKTKFTYVKFNQWFSVEEVGKEEGIVLNQYITDGWNILNRNKTGGLGAQSKKWTKEACREAAIACESVSEFKEKSPSAYTLANNGRFWKEISGHLSRKIEKDKWNEKTILATALKFETRKEFSKKYGGAYNKARDLGILTKVCKHMTRLVRKSGYWAKKTILEEALHYQHRSDFNEGCKAAYVKASKMGWLDDVCKHMSPKRVIKWTYEGCSAEAQKYESRAKFKSDSPGAYQTASDKDWLEDICKNIPKKKINMVNNEY